MIFIITDVVKMGQHTQPLAIIMPEESGRCITVTYEAPSDNLNPITLGTWQHREKGNTTATILSTLQQAVDTASPSHSSVISA
jgi:hypothetical protein